MKTNEQHGSIWDNRPTAKVRIDDVLNAGKQAFNNAINFSENKVKTRETGVAFLLLKKGEMVTRLTTFIMSRSTSQVGEHVYNGWKLNLTNRGACLYLLYADPNLQLRYVGHKAVSDKFVEFEIESEVDVHQF